MANVDSSELLKPIWFALKFLGTDSQDFKYKIIYYIYRTIIMVFVTIGYPLHLGLAVFSFPTAKENIKNLALFVICSICSFKFMTFMKNINKIREIEEIVAKLDIRIEHSDEMKYFQKLRKTLRYITYAFFVCFVPVAVTAEFNSLYQNERTLLYPAWFPFNWQGSETKFMLANLYQTIGLSLQLLQNYVNDCFPPTALSLLSGHIRVLGLRLSKIGHNNENEESCEKELRRCIEDQKNIHKLYDLIQEIISIPIFLQFAVSAFNMGIIIVAVLFLVDSPSDRLYYTAHFISMPTEIFPACYYGSELQYVYERLPYAIFSSNWVRQTRHYKKHMILFVERSLRLTKVYAAGMIPIHLNSFFSTCKGAYSLFTVLKRFNK